MRSAGSFCTYTFPFKHSGQWSPGFKEPCTILTRRAPPYAWAPFRPCPGFGGPGAFGGGLLFGGALIPACSSTLLVFSVLGFDNSARSWLIVVFFSPILSIRTLSAWIAPSSLWQSSWLNGRWRARSTNAVSSSRFTSICSFAGFIPSLRSGRCLLYLRQQLTKMRRERIPQHFLDRPVRSLVRAVLAPPRRAPHHHPVRRPIAGAAVAFGIDEGLEKIDGVPVDAFPVRRDSSRHLTENVRRQMRDADPRQNEIARIVGKKTVFGAPRLRTPADKAIAGPQMTWRRRPGQTGNHPARSRDQIFDVFPNRPRVAEWMILGDEVVEERLLRRAPHLLELQGPEHPQGRFQGRGIEQQRSQGFLPVRGAPGHGVAMHLPRGRQLQAPRPLQLQEESAAHHVAPCAVGLLPAPRLA